MLRCAVGVLVAASLLISLGQAPVWATSFIERPFQETLQDAPMIVRGTVGMKYSDWVRGTNPADRRIYTFYELRVDEVLKGSLTERSIIMRELGGQKDGMGMEVAGSAKFERGEDVVVLLGPKNSDGSFDVHGLMMGRYEIHKDEDGREYLEGPGIIGTHGGAHGHRADLDGGSPTPVQRWTLEAVRDTLARQAAASGGSATSAVNSRLEPRSAPDAPVSASARPTAPGLQPDHPAMVADPAERTTDGNRSMLVWIVGILLGLGGWFFFRRRLRK